MIDTHCNIEDLSGSYEVRISSTPYLKVPPVIREGLKIRSVSSRQSITKVSKLSAHLLVLVFFL